VPGYTRDMARRIALRRIPRRRGAAIGVLLVLLGLWGGLIPFVGPYFNYQIGTTSTWDWSADRLWLSVLPAAATVLGGLLMIYSTRRSTASLGGLLALAGGLWFVAGPSVSMLWNHGAPATGAAVGDTGTRVLEWLGFHYGTGALITLLSAYGLGFLAALPVVDEAVPAAAPPAAAADAPPANGDGPADTAAAPPTRRRRFGRRRRAARDPEPVERR
jgi:hypothetical protein